MPDQSRQLRIQPGRRYPPGATVEDAGVNFSIFSRHATGAELLLYVDAESREPFQVVTLDRESNRTYFSWHVLVEDLPPGTHYTWRMSGPFDPHDAGCRFDSRVELVDPWALAINPCRWDRVRRQREGVLPHDSPRALVLAEEYDWEGDAPLNLPPEETIIYELHVGGFTRHPSSGVQYPGTFAGLIEMIPYLQQLGINHVELLPVMAFDEQDVPEGVAQAGLSNFWGYSTYGFFSPHHGYCVAPHEGGHVREFRDMVKALHRAGIGVILDVVYNHTSEGGAGGPTLMFKGFGNETFYCLNASDKSVYLDFTGCGNTVSANHPMVTSFIVESLEYWVREMHVDGFRFDLASAMVRDARGWPMADPPVIWAIELSDTLAASRVIAEAWDAAGLYQVGSFPGYRWMEWNGRYRDAMRAFVRGDPGLIPEVATRLSGSSDLYQANLRKPLNSVNFITSHDGFTVWDLVSYNQKHNEANHENNRDGSNDNLSWNCGVEGVTDDPEILALRHRQAKNLLTLLFLSQGIPMLLAGDEVLRTQGGNNNAWCQDNELSWFDWSLVSSNFPMLRFVRGLIALRKRHANLQRRQFLSGQASDGGAPDIVWYNENLEPPAWHDPDSRILAFLLGPSLPKHASSLFVALNMSNDARDFLLPRIGDQRLWHLALDTGAPPPSDLIEADVQVAVDEDRRLVRARSILVLECRPGSEL